MQGAPVSPSLFTHCRHSLQQQLGFGVLPKETSIWTGGAGDAAPIFRLVAQTPASHEGRKGVFFFSFVVFSFTFPSIWVHPLVGEDLRGFKGTSVLTHIFFENFWKSTSAYAKKSGLEEAQFLSSTTFTGYRLARPAYLWGKRNVDRHYPAGW